MFSGRNVAIKQKTHIESSDTTAETDLITGQLVVDGVKPNTSDALSSCLMSSDSVIHSFSVLFSSPVVLYQLVITSMKARMNQMRGFRVDLYNELHQSVASYMDDGQKEVDTNEFTIHVNSTALIKKVIIHFPNKAENVKSLVICELEAYGDCGHPSYGLHCDDICSFHCLDLKCHVTGECWKCDDGWKFFCG
ncbi:hypothetical protein Btru_066200 [Bulinus truncatus]|nr:hypothetical protein Btru_066200 [Bulinus truncatus]